MRNKKWSDKQLKEAVKNSKSLRHVIALLGLKTAGGNYKQIQKYINELGLKTDHFTGKAWNKGIKMPFRPRLDLDEILVEDSDFQSFKLRNRLFRAGLKPQYCEECGWNKRTADGYLPLELDHINGKPRDNRIENLRILCPNCHSLKPTHRGKNRKK